MKFKLRQMEVFRAVMLTGSIKGAAKLLFISQPAASRIVAHTEATLRLKLFNRVRGKLVPTPEGEILFQEVDDFYQRALRVDEFAGSLAEGPSGTLNVSSSPCLGRGLMATTIARFAARYPGIRVNFRTTLLNDMAQELLGNKVNLAVSVLPLDHPNLLVTPIMEGRMVAVVPQGHALARLAAVSLQALAAYPLIVHHPTLPFGQLVHSALRHCNIQQAARIDTYQTDMACALVCQGAGVALVDQYTAAFWPELRVLPLQEEMKLTPSLVRSAFENGRSHIDKFVEILTAVAQELQQKGGARPGTTPGPQRQACKTPAGPLASGG
ncbi:LysR family transcriptional regulator [Teichococcus oryzae]|uniref:LysR family transcriptional regulator n=1 Tax=Teichococcus oryzae TaxID=1608942 RepID=A0A5B2THD1_9PROT|nr:LysR family transcriptional regulator [Pseudoroseomonas oryzae]KAA2213190.1 LysR family transcriptional regulator [Pseudoroseomonas oryzae]